MVSGINNNSMQNVNFASDIASQAISLANDLHGNPAQMIGTLGKLLENLGSLVGSKPANNAAPQPPINKKLADLVKQLTGALEGLSQALSGLQNAKGAGNAGGAGATGGTGQTSSTQDIAKALGLDKPQDLDGDQKAKTQAAAAGAKSGRITSMSQLLAIVGSILAKAQEDLMNKMADLAGKIDAKTGSGGPTTKDQQELQRMTFELQQIAQTLKTVFETVSNSQQNYFKSLESATGNLRA